jgi:hypothetical protein
MGGLLSMKYRMEGIFPAASRGDKKARPASHFSMMQVVKIIYLKPEFCLKNSPLGLEYQ